MEEGMGDLFDHIEDLLDFSNGDDVLGLLPPLPAPVAANAGGGLLGGAGDDSLQCSSNQTPCDELDAVQLEWMFKIFEDSSDSFFLDLPSCDAMAGNAGGNNASSPVSVLEAKTIAGGGGGGGDSSSSSSSTSASYSNGGNDVRALRPPVSPPEAPPVPMIPARARSKRSRAAATFPPRPHLPIPYLPPSSDVFAVSDPESFGECCPLPPPPKKKKNAAAAADAAEGEESATPPPVRKCMHCGIQKTPQWRAGPMGPKTLCNACGVRYKSGRLFPEYRPAASPTFVPSLHSNSHKKVVEMRIKASQKAAAGPMSSSDGCDLLEYIRRKD